MYSSDYFYVFCVEVDGEKIDFLVKKDVYKPTQEESEKSANDDDYVLSKLFKSTGNNISTECF